MCFAVVLFKTYLFSKFKPICCMVTEILSNHATDRWGLTDRWADRQMGAGLGAGSAGVAVGSGGFLLAQTSQGLIRMGVSLYVLV